MKYAKLCQVLSNLELDLMLDLKRSGNNFLKNKGFVKFKSRLMKSR